MGRKLWQQVRLVVDHTVRGLCARPYEGHRRGCPNFGRCGRCPPQAPLVERVLDLTEPVWVAWSTFDLGSHVRRMRERHPNWSDRQLACCLYWQPKARTVLRSVVGDFLESHPGLHVLWTPEACGVDVTATMAQIGERLEWPPVNVTYQVVVAGTRYSNPYSTLG